jgi:hypothetical protein
MKKLMMVSLLMMTGLISCEETASDANKIYKWELQFRQNAEKTGCEYTAQAWVCDGQGNCERFESLEKWFAQLIVANGSVVESFKSDNSHLVDWLEMNKNLVDVHSELKNVLNEK